MCDHDLALLCLEAGVVYTYNTYVRAVGQGRKMTEEERMRARSIARTKARHLGDERGISTDDILDVDFIPLYIERIIERKKNVCRQKEPD